ncbi:MAG: transporter substrate-binding protein, partial [Chloroflexi bacterium]|nr:transporter substrate-binding protein [Chloroflexota bacterium]
GLLNAPQMIVAGDNDGSIRMLAEGRTSFAMDAHPEMLIEANAKGADIAIVGSYRNGLPFGIAARPGAIKDASELQGKRFTTNRRLGAGERMVRATFKKLGFDPDEDIEVVLIPDEGVQEKYQAIKTGRADYLVYHFNGPQGDQVGKLIAQGELEQVVDLSTLFPHYVVRSIASSGRVLREQPDDVVAFLRGVMQAHVVMKSSESTRLQSVDVLKRALNVDSLEGSGVENGVPRSWFVEPEAILASVEGVQAHVEELQAEGKLAAAYSAERIVRNDLAEIALAQVRG